MKNNDIEVDRFIEEIAWKAGPIIEQLHLRIIDRGCEAARETLLALDRAASNLHEEIHQQDFVSRTDFYEASASECLTPRKTGCSHQKRSCSQRSPN